MRNDPYNELVRACFENPVHAGDVDDRYAHRFTAESSESDQGARVVLSAGVEDGTIAEMRFRAWGCPHLIATVETVCSELEGQPVAALDEVEAKRLMDRLSVPVAKTGRLLLIEDAARSLSRQID